MPRGRPKKVKRDRRQGYRAYKVRRAVSPGPASTGSESEKNLQELASEIEAVNDANPRGQSLSHADIEAAMAHIHADASLSDDNLVNEAYKVQTNKAMQGTSRATRHSLPVGNVEDSEEGIYYNVI